MRPYRATHSCGCDPDLASRGCMAVHRTSTAARGVPNSMIPVTCLTVPRPRFSGPGASRTWLSARPRITAAQLVATNLNVAIKLVSRSRPRTGQRVGRRPRARHHRLLPAPPPDHHAYARSAPAAAYRADTSVDRHPLHPLPEFLAWP